VTLEVTYYYYLKDALCCLCAGGARGAGVEQEGRQRPDYVTNVLRAARRPHVGVQTLPEHQVHTCTRRASHQRTGELIRVAKMQSAICNVIVKLQGCTLQCHCKSDFQSSCTATRLYIL
jgi:hypothetical protein